MGTEKRCVTYWLPGGDEWANGRPQDDDVTFVVLKIKE